MPGFDQLTQPPGVGRILAGRYRLVSPIARGGMAEVWEGHDEVLYRPVAVKVLQAHLAADGVFLERFRREAVTAARLGHPGITATFDTGIDQGTAFIVMELVRGRNLRQLLGDYGRLEPWQAVAVTRQIADALAYAHQAGLVHRDVKPANILLVEDELGSIRVKVTDFGIAKAGMKTGHDLTRTGIVLGTPKYLSPEQIRGIDPDPRADLYSLGVVLYEMLVGEPPFVGENDMATALAHLNERVPKPSASVRGVPGGLDRIVTDLLAKNPDRRIQSANELRQRLDGLGPLTPLAGGRAGAGSVPERSAGRRGVRRRHDPVPPRPSVGVPLPPLRPAPGSVRPPAPAASGNGAGPGTPTPARPAPDTRFTPGPPPPPPGATTVLPPADATRVDAGTGSRGRDGTSVLPPGTRPDTDQFGPPPRPDRKIRRSERTAGFVVLGLVVVGAIVAATLLSTRSHGHGSTATSIPPATSAASGAVKVIGVSVFMNNGRSPDNPGLTHYAFDGNPSTYWESDVYNTPTFGNLYSGIGLEIELASSATLHSLTVTSPTTGWAASTYISANAVASGQQLSAWGQSTDSKSAIGGDAKFSLGKHKGRYVLLWITNLGPNKTARIGEVAVS